MRRIRLLAILFGVLALFGACADGDDDPSAEPDATESTEATEAPADSDESGAVEVAESDLGEILTDGEGNTLYMFMKDADGDSACVDACAEKWPPFTADGDPIAGDGVDEDELGTIDREDGEKQVTYHDIPLYTYSGDAEAGDTEGQGVGGNWYVVDPDGEMVMEEAG